MTNNSAGPNGPPDDDSAPCSEPETESGAGAESGTAATNGEESSDPSLSTVANESPTSQVTHSTPSIGTREGGSQGSETDSDRPNLPETTLSPPDSGATRSSGNGLRRNVFANMRMQRRRQVGHRWAAAPVESEHTADAETITTAPPVSPPLTNGAMADYGTSQQDGHHDYPPRPSRPDHHYRHYQPYLHASSPPPPPGRPLPRLGIQPPSSLPRHHRRQSRSNFSPIPPPPPTAPTEPHPYSFRPFQGPRHSPAALTNIPPIPDSLHPGIPVEPGGSPGYAAFDGPEPPTHVLVTAPAVPSRQSRVGELGPSVQDFLLWPDAERGLPRRSRGVDPYEHYAMMADFWPERGPGGRYH